MHMLLPIHGLYVASGFGVGLLVGLTGVGGGSLMTPLLVLLFGFHPATAVGTDLLYAASTKSVGTAMHGVRHTIEWRIVRRLALGSVPGAVATLLILSLSAVQSRSSSHALSIALGVALLLSALSLLFRPYVVGFVARRMGEPSERKVAALTVATGLVLGIAVSLTSVGAGALGMTALLLLYPRVPVARLVGSDIAHAVPLTLIAGVGHWLIGTVDWPLLATLLIGSVPGVLLGSHLAARTSELVLRPLLAAALFLAGSQLVW